MVTWENTFVSMDGIDMYPDNSICFQDMRNILRNNTHSDPSSNLYMKNTSNSSSFEMPSSPFLEPFELEQIVVVFVA
jgi:hypothetical protein